MSAAPQQLAVLNVTPPLRLPLARDAGWLRAARRAKWLAGEGVQNLLCAGQAAAALVALVGASVGLAVLDPLAGLLIAGIAAKEGVELWRGEDSCCATPGLDLAAADSGCADDCCARG